MRDEKINGKHISDKVLPELIYVYDALCGWCYGFSPVITRLQEELKDEVDLLVLSGGMVRDENPGSITQVASYIQKAYKVVENTCDVKFGDKFIHGVLEERQAVFSSMPPARALATFRVELPQLALNYATRLQQTIYYEGTYTDDIEAFGRIAEEYGIEPNGFLIKMQNEETRQIVENEFSIVESMGVNAYPSLVLRNGSRMDVLLRGYRDYITTKGIIKDALV